MSLPVADYNTNNINNNDSFRPLGCDNDFMRSFNFYDVDSVAGMVRNITKQAAAKSPFIWHKARRHAPTQSGICAKPRPQTYGTQSRMHIGAVEFHAENQIFEVDC